MLAFVACAASASVVIAFAAAHGEHFPLHDFGAVPYVLAGIAVAVVLFALAGEKLATVANRAAGGHSSRYIRMLNSFSNVVDDLDTLHELSPAALAVIARAVGAKAAYLFLSHDPNRFALTASTKAVSVPRLMLLCSNVALDTLRAQHDKGVAHRGFLQLKNAAGIIMEENTILFAEIEVGLILPLWVSDDLIAILVLGPKASRRPYGQKDVRTLATLPLSRIVSNFKDSRAYEVEKRRRQKADVLDRISQIVTAGLNPLKGLRPLMEELQTVLRIDLIDLAVDSAETGWPKHYTVSSIDLPPQTSAGVPEMGYGADWVMTHAEVHYQPDLYLEARFDCDRFLRQSGFRSVARLPVFLDNDVEACFTVAAASPDAYSLDDLSFLGRVTAHLSIAISNAKLFNEERRLREHLQQKEKEKALFIEAIVHEMGTPLTAIRASSELLLYELPEGSTSHELAVNLDYGSRALRRRLSDLACFAQLDSPNLPISFTAVDVSEVVRSTSGELLPLVRHKEQDIKLQLESWGPLAWADPARLEQIVLNLLTNASKFSPPAGQITVQVYRMDGHVAVEVTDSAPSITAEEKENLFRPYYRGKQAKNIPGFGLGLTICKRLVELQGGEIQVQPGKGGGNVFRFTMPLFQDRVEADHAQIRRGK